MKMTKKAMVVCDMDSVVCIDVASDNDDADNAKAVKDDNDDDDDDVDDNDEWC